MGGGIELGDQFADGFRQHPQHAATAQELEIAFEQQEQRIGKGAVGGCARGGGHGWGPPFFSGVESLEQFRQRARAGRVRTRRQEVQVLLDEIGG